MQVDDVPINQNIKLKLSTHRFRKEIFMYFTLYVPDHSNVKSYCRHFELNKYDDISKSCGDHRSGVVFLNVKEAKSIQGADTFNSLKICNLQ